MSGLAPLVMPAGLPAGMTVWHLALDLERDHADDHSVLIYSEHARAARYRHAADRRRYVQARACLRRLLGLTLACPPAAVPLETTPQGKPTLPGKTSPVFNLSHAGEHAYLVLAEQQAVETVGIDIEQCPPPGPLPEWLTLACGPAEVDTVRQAENPLACLTLHWSAKEALIKALGTGLSDQLPQMHIAHGPGNALVLHTPLTQARDIRLARLAAPPGYAAALAWRQA